MTVTGSDSCYISVTSVTVVGTGYFYDAEYETPRKKQTLKKETGELMLPMNSHQLTKLL